MAGEEVASLWARLGLHVDSEEWNRGDKIIERMKHAAEGIAAFFAVKEIGEFVGKTVEAGAQAEKMSEKLGISAESVSELAHVAERSETNIEELSGAVFKLSHGLSNDLAKGTGPVLDALGHIGIKSSEVSGLMSGPGGVDDMLGLIADKFAAMEEGPQKAAYAMDLFGRSGSKLIPFLNNGSAGIAALRAEAHELGVTFTDDQAKGFDEIEENWGRVKEGFSGLRNEVVKAAMPVLKSALDWLVGALKDAVAWVHEHADSIQDFFMALGRGIKFAGTVIYTVIQYTAAFVHAVIDAVSMAIDVVEDFASFMYENVIEPLLNFIAKLWAFVKPIITTIGNALGVVRDKAIAIFDAIVSAGHKIIDFFVEVGQRIRDALESAFDYVANLPVIKQLVDAVKGIHNFIKGDDSPGGGGGIGERTVDWLRNGDDGANAAPSAAAAAAVDKATQAMVAPVTAMMVTPSGRASSSTTIQVGDINIDVPQMSPGADAQTYASTIGAHVRASFADLLDEHLTSADASVEEVG